MTDERRREETPRQLSTQQENGHICSCGGKGCCPDCPNRNR